MEAAGIAEEKKGSLFRSANRRTGQLTANPLSSSDAWAMVRRRATAAGIETAIGCHTFRATGITIYLTNGGTLEKAQMMAAHSSPHNSVLEAARVLTCMGSSGTEDHLIFLRANGQCRYVGEIHGAWLEVTNEVVPSIT